MFRTALPPTSASFQVQHDQSLLSLGSCFASSMGDRLERNKFNILVNPFGTLFSPMAINRILRVVLGIEEFSEDKIIHREGVYLHYDMHSALSAAQKFDLLTKIKSKVKNLQDWLQTSQPILLLTLGTAFSYQLKDSQVSVANCHKQPSKLFDKVLLQPAQIASALSETFDELKARNPSLKIILTVSPVRHTKDSLPLNTVSKASLRLAAHELAEKHHDLVHYFPSYEIMMDDLRDYRFYKADLIHPNDQAENYIWEHFSQGFFSKETQSIVSKWQKIQQAIAHKPFNPESEGHQRFLQDTLSQLGTLAGQLNVDAEIALIKAQIK
ncbi:GSCFA domain-containing protein [Penaeicola halotolerans]|uniref:GSCFA domain-containing protein n=1 Tax=Penaeicola halotolerans TaxID=2793196 RepID=UPI001CF8C9CE|nr:GSCFA domain-containing protein [Penaeicola halotolerans]